MELGARLRQARLEAGMSQRQLCGDVITRNMLSQIENGSAKPSVETLLYIAGRLGKPVSCFLEDQPEGSPNQRLILKLRAAQPAQRLALLEEYQSPDELLDPERYWLEAQACMELAQQAIDTGRLRYAAELLEQARQAEEKTPYDTRRQRLALCYRAKAMAPRQIAQQLPSLDEELLLRSHGALEAGDFSRCKALLEAVQHRQQEWNYLMGMAHLQLGDYENARSCLQKAEDWDKKQVYAALERCCTGLEDYKMAYTYACKLRDLEKGNTIFFFGQDV